jgi:hypothetical protein
MEDHSHAGQGPVLLDIGGTVGALIVHMPVTMAGDEIELIPDDAGDQPPRHVAVVARPARTRVSLTAVFPDVPEGTYALHRRPGGPVRLRATVTGGQITEARWPE